MSIEEQLREISANLFTLPAEKVAKLAWTLEGVRGVPRGGDFADAALAMIRPRLRRDRPMRLLTPQRVFCRPFEDLLDVNPSGDKVRGRIARSAIKPVWDLFLAEADPARFQKEARAIAAQAQPTMDAFADDQRMLGLGATFWPFAAEVLGAILAKAERSREQRAALIRQVGHNVYYELIDMQGVMQIADRAIAVTELLAPKPLDVLRDDQANAFKAELVALAESGSGKPAYLIMLALARLKDPFSLVKLTTDLGALESGFQRENVGTFTQVTLAQAMGLMAERIAGQDKFDGEALSDQNIAQLGADLSKKLARFEETIGGDAARQVRSSFSGAKDKLKQMVNEGVVAAANDVVVSGIVDGMTARRRIAGTASDADEEMAIKLQLAGENRARALRQCLIFAEDIGMKRELEAKVAAISREIEQSTQVMLNGLSFADMRGGGRGAVELEVNSAARMLELVAGPQAADKLRRQGLAAIAEKAGDGLA